MQRAILVGYFPTAQKDAEIELLMHELELLSDSAGAKICDRFTQKKDPPDRRTLIGSGKVEEIKCKAKEHNADLIIFHNSLSPLQGRNLEDSLGLLIVDRTRLILDIFATRARSREGKLQVELAQLLYLLPRLTGKGVELSRLGGGIGTRGPGETKLESDRRVIRQKIAAIKEKLEKVMCNRETQRKHRHGSPVPVVSLVGYTSSGKSTLFKRLTAEDVLISRQLFSTLDPLLRKVDLRELGEGYYALLSDTVGFIRSMPSELFTAFRATFEEVLMADVILHVVDMAHADFRSQQQEVEAILEQIGISGDRVVTVYNKIDLLTAGVDLQAGEENNAVFVSAKTGQGIAALKRAIFSHFFNDFKRYQLLIPIAEFNHDAWNRWAIVLKKEYQAEGVWLEFLCSQQNMLKYQERHGGHTQ